MTYAEVLDAMNLLDFLEMIHYNDCVTIKADDFQLVTFRGAINRYVYGQEVFELSVFELAFVDSLNSASL